MSITPFLVAALLLVPVLSCGTERWSVKVVDPDGDPDSMSIKTTPVSSTIALLTSYKAPDLSQYPSSRVNPQEFTVFQISAYLAAYKTESDQDIHTVMVSDPSIQSSADCTANPGSCMIAEFPNQSCVPTNSPLHAKITAARAAFEAQYTASSKIKWTGGVPVCVTGVGFFDFLHGQTGVAPNGFELHPVIGIKFGQDCNGNKAGAYSDSGSFSDTLYNTPVIAGVSVSIVALIGGAIIYFKRRTVKAEETVEFSQLP